MDIEQLSLFRPATWTVVEITKHIRDLFETDSRLRNVWVRGEVSNFSRPRSGHIYFTLKDEFAALRCVMWRSMVVGQSYLPQDGDAVEVRGNVTVYEAGGQYQLYAEEIRPAGKGALYREFLRLKARLQAEGLFDESRKRPIPPMPNVIGVVTSATGAALRDILNTLRRRYPLAEVILAPTPVQGNDAPAGIIHAIEALNRTVRPDVILLARGGGSIEDLWAFNDPGVAYAIAGSQAPVITGVGHQTDFTIADFVADLRAPTPTAAAELATPERAEITAGIAELEQKLNGAMLFIIENERWRIIDKARKLDRLSPLGRIRSYRQRIDEFTNRAGTALSHRIEIGRTTIRSLEQRLLSANPLAILARGYALVAKEDGTIIRSAAMVDTGDAIHVRVARGRFDARVTSVPDEQPD